MDSLQITESFPYSGVGFGACARLLVQFSDPTPSDTLGSNPALANPDDEPLASPFAAPNGIVLIMGCRNAIKAHKARQKLQNILDHLALLPDDAPTPVDLPSHFMDPVHVDLLSTDDDVDSATLQSAAQASLRRRRQRSAQVLAAVKGLASEEEELLADVPQQQPLLFKQANIKARGIYRRRFCVKTTIAIQPLDLGSMASVLKSAQEIIERHHYVTHAILNAGLAVWQGLNWPLAIWQMMTSFRTAVTWPKYKRQRAGDLGADGYGWVWQCNVAAHYVLVRALLPAFRATPFKEPSRIVWTGSIEAYERYYHPEDYQCLDPIKSGPTYESTKYQCELLGLGLDERLRSEHVKTLPGTPMGEAPPAALSQVEPRSYISHPGVVASSMFEDYLGWVLVLALKLVFYLARWVLSPHHLISAYKAGIVISYLATCPSERLDTTIRYAPRCNFWGQEYIHRSRIDGWVTDDDAATEAGKKIMSVASQVAGPGVGGIESEAKGEEGEDAGKHVMELARDLVGKLEAVASDVWKQAGAARLPPFNITTEVPSFLTPSGANLRSKKASSDDGSWENVEK